MSNYNNIALCSKDWKERMDAIKHVTDQHVLSIIALNDGNSDIKLEAVRRITDQGELFEVATKSNINTIKLEAINGINNQTLLQHIVLNPCRTLEPCVVLAVAKKITDQTVLKTIFKHYRYAKVRKAIFNKLSDETISLL
ncbi:MAG: hypothetical protein E7311_02195 [Clostridiales bacterium]|nr:hypothetical protein [Clostridiales bacterium]